MMFENRRKYRSVNKAISMNSGFSTVYNARMRDDKFTIPEIKNVSFVSLVDDIDFHTGTFSKIEVSLCKEVKNELGRVAKTALYVSDENGDNGKFFVRAANITVGSDTHSDVPLVFDENSQCFHDYKKFTIILDALMVNSNFAKIRGMSIHLSDVPQIEAGEESDSSKPRTYGGKSDFRRMERHLALNALYNDYVIIVESGNYEEHEVSEFMAKAAVVIYNLSERPVFARRFATGKFDIDKNFQSQMSEAINNSLEKKTHINASDFSRLVYNYSILGPEISDNAEYASFKFLEHNDDEKLKDDILQIKNFYAILDNFGSREGIDKQALFKSAAHSMHIVKNESFNEGNAEKAIASLWKREFPGRTIGQSSFYDDNSSKIPSEVIDFLYTKQVTEIFGDNDKVLELFIEACKVLDTQQTIDIFMEDGELIDINATDVQLSVIPLSLPLLAYHGNNKFSLGISNELMKEFFYNISLTTKGIQLSPVKKDIIGTAISTIVTVLNDSEKLLRFIKVWPIIQEYMWTEKLGPLNEQYNVWGDMVKDARDETSCFLETAINDDNIMLLINRKITPNHYYQILVKGIIEERQKNTN